MFVLKIVKISLLILLYSVALISCRQPSSQTLTELQSKIRDNTDSVALVLNSLQPEYEDMNEADKALFDLCLLQIAAINAEDFPPLEDIDRCIAYFEKHKNPKYAAEGYYAKATYYKENRTFDKANECLLKALDLSEKVKHEPLSARIYFNLGHIAYMQDKYETGTPYLVKSVDLHRSLEYPAYSTNMSLRYYHLANFFANAEQYDSVIKPKETVKTTLLTEELSNFATN